MGFFSSITNSIGNVLSRAGSGPLAGLPSSFFSSIPKTISPLFNQTNQALKPLATPVLQPIGTGSSFFSSIPKTISPLFNQTNQALKPLATPVLQPIGTGSSASPGPIDITMKTPAPPNAESFPTIGGLGAPEQLPGGGYRVWDNRAGKWIYGGGAVDPNAPQPSPAPAPAPGPAEPPATPDIGQIVGPRSFGGGGFLGNLMSILGGAFPQGPVTENAPPGFGRFLRRMAASRFSI